MEHLLSWRRHWRASRRLLCLWLLLAPPASAVTVQADIKNGQLRWVSAQASLAGGVVPSIWATPTGLVPATVFIPGGSALATVNVSAIGPRGIVVPLTLSLRGMEYNTPEVSSNRPDDGGGTAKTSFQRGLIQVEGTGIGNAQAQLSKEISPFTHARPILSLGDTAQVLRAFEQAKAVTGTYVAQLSIPVVYDYLRGGVRVRHNWTLPLELRIDYSPAVLTDVTVVSPTLGVITPRYSIRGGVTRVQGETVFAGTATGVFVNGLRMRLKPGDSYRMVEATPDPADPQPKFIPYSVTCTACDTPELVVEGVPTTGMTTKGVHVAGSNVNTITFSIKVGFADIALSELRTGAYRGQFSLLFEPHI